jgi:hypothetical protein
VLIAVMLNRTVVPATRETSMIIASPPHCTAVKKDMAA